MPAELPKASELALAAGEETPAVAKLHGEVIAALCAHDVCSAQLRAADLLDELYQREKRRPGPKTQQLIDFVLLVS